MVLFYRKKWEFGASFRSRQAALYLPKIVFVRPGAPKTFDIIAILSSEIFIISKKRTNLKPSTQTGVKPLFGYLHKLGNHRISNDFSRG